MDKAFRVLTCLVFFILGYVIMLIIEKSLIDRHKNRIEDHDYEFSEIDDED